MGHDANKHTSEMSKCKEEDSLLYSERRMKINGKFLNNFREIDIE
mgnify:FL=1